MTNEEKVKAFDIILEKKINVRFLLYTFNRRLGLRLFNQGRTEQEKVTVEEFEFLKEKLYASIRK